MAIPMLISATLAGLAGALLIAPFSAGRLPVQGGDGCGSAQPWYRSPVVAGALAGVATWLLVGGPAGLVAGVVVGLAAPRLLVLLEPAAKRRRRAELTRSAPLVADLLGAAMISGVTLEQAIPVLSRAFGGSVAEVLDTLYRRLALGMDPEKAWGMLAREPGMGALGRAAARSARTGAPLAEMLVASGDELRAAATAQGLSEIRSAGVKAVLPLGLCLLPAFVLLGIVPVVAGMIPQF
jgi:pilus assembly protein TadC